MIAQPKTLGTVEGHLSFARRTVQKNVAEVVRPPGMRGRFANSATDGGLERRSTNLIRLTASHSRSRISSAAYRYTKTLNQRLNHCLACGGSLPAKLQAHARHDAFDSQLDIMKSRLRRKSRMRRSATLRRQTESKQRVSTVSYKNRRNSLLRRSHLNHGHQRSRSSKGLTDGAA